ncbi:hypothetical protein A6P54_13370 [Bacillus sp. MKU004]|nr:hypothetical protein A6P54_13370 [Bacillus sp. MKU004]
MSYLKGLMKVPVIANILSFGSATLISSALAFILGVVSRNILGPEKYGYWVALSIAFTFIPLLQFGVLNAMNREIPYHIARGASEKVHQIRQKTISYLLSFPAFMMLLFLMVSILLWNSNLAWEYKVGFFFISFIGLLLFLSSYVEMYYKSIQDFQKVSKLIGVKGIVQAISSILFIVLFGFIGLFLGMIVALLIQIMIGRKAFNEINFNFNFRFKDYLPLIKIGFPILMVGLIWSIFLTIDKLILTIMMDSSSLGNYSIALLVFSTMMLLPQVVAQVYYPKVVAMVSREEHEQIKQSYVRVNSLLLLISTIIVTVGIVVIPSVIRLLMPEYEEGIFSAQILLVGLVPLTLVNYSANYFNATDNQRLYIKILLISMLVNILASTILLLFNREISMVAIGTSISFLLYFLLMNVFFWKLMKQQLKGGGNK